jgi:Glycosyl transferase family 2
VKLVMTLLVRDEADIVDAQIAFHLHAGVDFVVATDNRSEDGTTEILERYEREGVLHLLRENAEDMRQAEWVTRMARLAATEYAADWVINSDADEFWWPRAGSLKDVLAAVPERYGVVRGCWRHFLSDATADPNAPFYERMTVRLRTPAHPGEKATILHAHQKVAHRADPHVVVEVGNHDALGDGLAPLRDWYPLEVLHFSFRSLAQLERKAIRDWSVWSRSPHGLTLHMELAREAAREGRLDEYFASFAVGEETLARAIDDGSLARDTRLRDALRSISEPDSGFRLPAPNDPPALSFPRLSARDDAAYAGEASVLAEIDGIPRAERRVDAFEERLAALERRRLSRVLVDWRRS